jgi:hypothetical protein
VKDAFRPSRLARDTRTSDLFSGAILALVALAILSGLSRPTRAEAQSDRGAPLSFSRN